MNAPSVRKRAITAMVAWLLFGMGLVQLAVHVDERFVWALLVLFLGIGIYISSLRCPGCGSRITKWGGWSLGRCSECGLRLP